VIGSVRSGVEDRSERSGDKTRLETLDGGELLSDPDNLVVASVW